MNNFKFKIEKSLSKINKSEWNNCANTDDSTYNPFVSYEFLNALEVSQSINNDTGWFSTYLLAESNEGELLGCVPSFIKNNSNGEYVFDHEWANAYQRSGGSYYPKIQVSIPFTPVTGRRFLVKDRLKDINIISELSYELSKLTKETNASSAHVTFLTKKESDILKELGWLTRKDQQFHWKNNNYKNFDEFLSTLTSRKRKNIKKERSAFEESSIEIEHIEGRDDTMKDNLLLIMAKKNDHYIAGALNFIGGDRLYGRNWGCTEDHKFLHFELCYYQAIEYAISNKYKYVEAGAQGTHKIARGYSPDITYSAHWMKERNFSDAVEQYLKYEDGEVEKSKKMLESYLPYKKEV